MANGPLSIRPPRCPHFEDIMSESISNTAIIYAILALNSEIALQKEYLHSPDLPDAEAKNEMEILGDMEQAFAEFIGIYKIRRKTAKQLPDIDELLNNPL